MASNMSLEEKIDFLLKGYQTIIAQNEEIKASNNYLKTQLEQLERQKRRTRESPTRKPRLHPSIEEDLRRCAMVAQEAVPVARLHPLIEEDLRRCSMVEHEEVVETTENPSKLHTPTPPHTFHDKLTPCGVVEEEFEPSLPQKESLPSQQELRTILFEEGENDVDFQGVHFLFPNSPSWESSSMQTHAWPYSFVTFLFEFLDKRHVMEFYLARKELDQSKDDGDPPWGHS